MKKDIHPNYRPVVFQDNGADFAILTKSTVETKETITWKDGKEYPVFMLDTSAASHPVYTGQQREHNKLGRASAFNQRYGSMMSALKKDN